MTKWDLLKDYKLLDVKRFLLRSDSFSSVVNTRRMASKPTYLIPVSSVGNYFARYDRETGEMVKHPDAVFNPYHLDVCLAAAVSDTLMTSFKTNVSNRDLFWFNIVKALLGAATATKWLGDKGRAIISEEWTSKIFAALQGLGSAGQTEFSHYHDEAARRMGRITDRNSALDEVVMVQKGLVNAFLKKYPSADLLLNQDELA